MAQAASTAPANAPTAAPTAYGVQLAEAAEKVSDTIAMGARDGISVARIELSPESLGAIQIHLQHTPDGIVARVITEHPEAAQTLSQGSDDLSASSSRTAPTSCASTSSPPASSARPDGQAASPRRRPPDGSSSASGSADEDAADERHGPTSPDTPFTPFGLRARQRARLRRAPPKRGPLT